MTDMDENMNDQLALWTLQFFAQKTTHTKDRKEQKSLFIGFLYSSYIHNATCGTELQLTSEGRLTFSEIR